MSTGLFGLSQSQKNDSFFREVDENAQLFSENMNMTVLEIDTLILKAIELKDTLSELTLLDRKCRYYYSKSQIDSLIETSETMRVKANLYQNLYALIMSHVYMAEAYSINQLYNRALVELNSAYKTLEQNKLENPNIIYAKANILNSFANIYTDVNEPGKAVEKLYEVIKSHNMLKNPDEVGDFSN
jgi:hypothetical protein